MVTQLSRSGSEAHVSASDSDSDARSQVQTCFAAAMSFFGTLKPSLTQQRITRKIINCRLEQEKKTLILDAPPGIGKTLASFNALLSMLKAGVFGKLHIVVKTQAQVKTWCDQIKLINSTVRVVCLGTRIKMCTNPRVVKMKGDINANCMDVCRKGQCKMRKTKLDEFNGVLDIEDTVTLARSGKGCAYFHAQESDCDIVIYTYFHLVSQRTKRDFHNCAILIDEAHNLASSCKQQFTVEFDLSQFSGVFSAGFGQTSVTVRDLCNHFRALPGWFVEEGIIADHCVMPWNTFVNDNAIDCAMLSALFTDMLSSNKRVPKTEHHDTLRSLINIMNAPQGIRKLLYVAKKMVSRTYNGQTINIPMVFIGLSNTGSMLSDRAMVADFMVFMSATLPSYHDALCTLGLDEESCAYYAENVTVKCNQILTIVGTGITGISSRWNCWQKKPDYFISIGNAIIQSLSCIRRGGIIITVPSRSYLVAMRACWNKHGVLIKLRNVCKPHFESKTDVPFNRFKADGVTTVSAFFLIARGRYSEGVNIPNYLTKMVIVCSVPYRPVHTSESALQRLYNKSIGLDIHKWRSAYAFNTYATVSQSVGRAVRWLSRAVVLLLDTRYDTHSQLLLPRYIGEPNITVHVDSLKQCKGRMMEFLAAGSTPTSSRNSNCSASNQSTTYPDLSGTKSCKINTIYHPRVPPSASSLGSRIIIAYDNSNSSDSNSLRPVTSSSCSNPRLKSRRHVSRLVGGNRGGSRYKHLHSFTPAAGASMLETSNQSSAIVDLSGNDGVTLNSFVKPNTKKQFKGVIKKDNLQKGSTRTICGKAAIGISFPSSSLSRTTESRKETNTLNEECTRTEQYTNQKLLDYPSDETHGFLTTHTEDINCCHSSTDSDTDDTDDETLTTMIQQVNRGELKKEKPNLASSCAPLGKRESVTGRPCSRGSMVSRIFKRKSVRFPRCSAVNRTGSTVSPILKHLRPSTRTPEDMRTSRPPVPKSTASSNGRSACVDLSCLDVDSSHGMQTKKPSSIYTNYTNKKLFEYSYDGRDALTIFTDDLTCCNDGEYLSDNCINLFTKLFFYGAGEGAKGEFFALASKVYCFSHSLFEQLFSTTSGIPTNAAYHRVKTWTKSIDIFDKSMLIFPILQDSHWSVVVVLHPNLLKSTNDISSNGDGKRINFMDDKRLPIVPAPVEMVHLDSLGLHQTDIVCETIRYYLKCELLKNVQQQRTNDTTPAIKIRKAVVPEQMNGYDCGVYVLHYISCILTFLLTCRASVESLVNWRDIEQSNVFSSSDIETCGKVRELRQRLAKTIRDMAISFNAKPEEKHKSGEAVAPASSDISSNAKQSTSVTDSSQSSAQPKPIYQWTPTTRGSDDEFLGSLTSDSFPLAQLSNSHTPPIINSHPETANSHSPSQGSLSNRSTQSTMVCSVLSHYSQQQVEEVEEPEQDEEKQEEDTKEEEKHERVGVGAEATYASCTNRFLTTTINSKRAYEASSLSTAPPTKTLKAVSSDLAEVLLPYKSGIKYFQNQEYRGRDDARTDFERLKIRFRREKNMERKTDFQPKLKEKFPDLAFFLGNSKELQCLKTMLMFYYYNNVGLRSQKTKKRLADTKCRIRKAIREEGDRSSGYCYYCQLWGDEDLISASKGYRGPTPTYVPSEINSLYFNKNIISGLSKMIEDVNAILVF